MCVRGPATATGARLGYVRGGWWEEGEEEEEEGEMRVRGREGVCVTGWMSDS